MPGPPTGGSGTVPSPLSPSSRPAPSPTWSVMCGPCPGQLSSDWGCQPGCCGKGRSRVQLAERGRREGSGPTAVGSQGHDGSGGTLTAGPGQAGWHGLRCMNSVALGESLTATCLLHKSEVPRDLSPGEGKGIKSPYADGLRPLSLAWLASPPASSFPAPNMYVTQPSAGPVRAPGGGVLPPTPQPAGWRAGRHEAMGPGGGRAGGAAAGAGGPAPGSARH